LRLIQPGIRSSGHRPHLLRERPERHRAQKFGKGKEKNSRNGHESKRRKSEKTISALAWKSTQKSLMFPNASKVGGKAEKPNSDWDVSMQIASGKGGGNCGRGT